MSDFKIIGNTDPVVGKEEFYSVNTFLPSILPFQNTASNNSFEQPVKWEIYILENGRWRKTKENDKTGKRVSYTFLQKSLERKGIRILARRGEDVARLNIKTHPAETPKIESIELLDKAGKKPTAPLSYGQTLKARVHCLHMEKRKVAVTLWEDDAAGAGHNKANEKNILQTLSGIVKDGKADVDFVLRPSFAKIANKSKDEGKIHEYYVTTDFDNEKLASKNVDVNDLETPVAPVKKKIPLQQPAQTKPPVQQPKANAPVTTGTEKAKKITRVHITDAAGRPIVGTFKEKQIKVWIDSVGLIGREIRLKLYEDDGDETFSDLLFDEKFTIKSNIYGVLIPLDTIPKSLGDDTFEGSQQELYADVQVLQTNITKQSVTVDVDSKVFKQDSFSIVNAVMKLFEPSKDDGNKDEKGTCPNCNKPVTSEELKRIFTQADEETLKKAADSYSKYMKDIGMNTCWNKAHFFAQAVVESGLKLKVKDGENFNWYYEKLPRKFSAFDSVEGRRNAELWGRAIEDRRDPRAVDVTLENQKKIANWAYSSNFSKGKELGNTSPNDGWNFRGKGLVQLTGRKAYNYANKYTIKEGANILNNSDLVSTDIAIAVLSSMAFFKWKDINTITNGNSNTKSISKRVGNDIDGSHEKKQNAFTDVTSKVFKINECKWKEEAAIAGNWHEPVDNPISTLYMQSGGGGRLGEHWGLFGTTRSGHEHQGLDLFAELGSNVYSCVKGVVYESKNHSGYGKTLTIKITDKEAFFNHRRDYKILYSNEGEIIQGQHFDKTQDIYLFYAHLREVLVTKGMSVDAGKVIAKSGVSGVVSGTCAPHLHFEIFTTLYAVGRRLNYRCNPGYYVHFKGASEQSRAEKDLQKKVAESGKIIEVNGKI
ncbi:peptidoglycan DD-metalloendopeptidase family protein [Flavobacterium hungaricum]|uniref:M23ase beta-sheet core domain-containing protein n=1 Tax=Flavobacterium hungaricum TaxID=2082725 RepID=A0ABR9TF22_9FLAO|nr:peptidoglycan DD-metalloendopeptidase family protein [Flavobacterium hungaricum]MBE8723876.1 hypothetical protein [Flavobacterium hungaricum]